MRFLGRRTRPREGKRDLNGVQATRGKERRIKRSFICVLDYEREGHWRGSLQKGKGNGIGVSSILSKRLLREGGKTSGEENRLGRKKTSFHLKSYGRTRKRRESFSLHKTQREREDSFYDNPAGNFGGRKGTNSNES